MRQNRILHWKITSIMRKERVAHTIPFETMADHFENILREKSADTDNATYDNECNERVKAELERLRNVIGKVRVINVEIRDICKRLKNNKACGSMGANNEMFKYAMNDRLDTIIAKS